MIHVRLDVGLWYCVYSLVTIQEQIETLSACSTVELFVSKGLFGRNLGVVHSFHLIIFYIHTPKVVDMLDNLSHPDLMAFMAWPGLVCRLIRH
jgi:hypothetical protein